MSIGQHIQCARQQHNIHAGIRDGSAHGVSVVECHGMPSKVRATDTPGPSWTSYEIEGSRMTVAAVSTLAEARAARDTAQKDVDRLFRQSSDLAAKIRQLADEAAKGRTVSGDLNNLAKQKSEIDLALLGAEEQLEACEQKFQQLQFNRIGNELGKALADARQARAEVAAAVKTACVQLGVYVRAMDRARQGHNQISSFTGYPSGSLRELQELDSANFCAGIVERITIEGNLRHDLDGGWRSVIEIRPLHQKI
jgi:hypothetical protein